jgi:hypothetical protein
MAPSRNTARAIAAAEAARLAAETAAADASNEGNEGNDPDGDANNDDAGDSNADSGNAGNTDGSGKDANNADNAGNNGGNAGSREDTLDDTDEDDDDTRAQAEELRLARLRARKKENKMKLLMLKQREKRYDAAMAFYEAELAKNPDGVPNMSAWSDVWEVTPTAPQQRTNGAPSSQIRQKGPLDHKLTILFDGKSMENIQSFTHQVNVARAASPAWADSDWVICAQNNMSEEVTHKWIRHEANSKKPMESYTIEEFTDWMNGLVCPPGLRAVAPMKGLLREYAGLSSRPTHEIIERVNKVRQEATDDKSTVESIFVILAYLACSESVQSQLLTGHDEVPKTMQELIRRNVAVKHLAREPTVVEPSAKAVKDTPQQTKRSYGGDDRGNRGKRPRASSRDRRGEGNNSSSTSMNTNMTTGSNNAAKPTTGVVGAQSGREGAPPFDGCWKCGSMAHIRALCEAPNCATCSKDDHTTERHGARNTSRVAFVKWKAEQLR